MKKIIISLIILSATGLSAQTTFVPNIFYNNFNYYNPAAGFNDSVNTEASLYLKHKWIDNEVYQKPLNVFASYLTTSKNRKHNYSVGYLFDDYSFYTRNLLYLGYSYRIDISEKSKLHLAARTALFFDLINWTSLGFVSEYSGNEMRFSPDLDFGIYYTLGRFRAGISTKNLMANQVSIDNQPLIRNFREVNLMLGYDARLGKNFTVSPFAFIQYERKFELNGGLALNYKQRLELNTMIRLTEARGIVALRGGITRKLFVGVAIDYSPVLTDINTDLSVQYRF